MIFEEFVAMHPATSGLTADALSESILKAVGDLGINIKDCVGQRYGGASVMSGQVNGCKQNYLGERSPHGLLDPVF